MHITVRLHTALAFLAGVVLTITAAFVLQPWRVGAAPGDDDATFVPITACRLIDTRADSRIGDGGTFDPDETRTLQATGTNGDCTLPDDAVGLVLNVTAVRATQQTFLTVWPDGSLPTASNLNPSPSAPPLPNAVTTQLADDGSFRVYNFQGSVDVIIDIVGYHTDSSLTEIIERLDSLDATLAANDTLARRALGFRAAVIDDAQVASSNGTTMVEAEVPVGSRFTLSICEPDGADCIDLTTGLITDPEGDGEIATSRFDATNVDRWDEVVARLTDGAPSLITTSESQFNADDDPIAGGSGGGGGGGGPLTGNERTVFSSSDSFHPVFDGLEGLEIGSITVEGDVLVVVEEDAGEFTFDTSRVFDVFFDLPGLPEPTD